MPGPPPKLKMFHYKKCETYIWQYLGDKWIDGKQYLIWQPIKKMCTRKHPTNRDKLVTVWRHTSCTDLMIMGMQAEKATDHKSSKDVYPNKDQWYYLALPTICYPYKIVKCGTVKI